MAIYPYDSQGSSHRSIPGTDADARPGYDAYDASEYLDEPEVLQARPGLSDAQFRDRRGGAVFGRPSAPSLYSFTVGSRLIKTGAVGVDIPGNNEEVITLNHR